MAQVHKETKTVKQIITTEEDVIILELSPLEAAGLRCLLQKVGGSPETSIRGQVQHISDALLGAGVKWQPAYDICETGKGSICFKDNTTKDLIV